MALHQAALWAAQCAAVGVHVRRRGHGHGPRAWHSLRHLRRRCHRGGQGRGGLPPAVRGVAGAARRAGLQGGRGQGLRAGAGGVIPGHLAERQDVLAAGGQGQGAVCAGGPGVGAGAAGQAQGRRAGADHAAQLVGKAAILVEPGAVGPLPSRLAVGPADGAAGARRHHQAPRERRAVVAAYAAALGWRAAGSGGVEPALD